MPRRPKISRSSDRKLSVARKRGNRKSSWRLSPLKPSKRKEPNKKTSSKRLKRQMELSWVT